MNDTHAGAFATGVFNADATGLMIGTTAVILEDLDHPASDLEREVVTMPTPLDDQYLVMAENGLAGRPVAHVLGELLASPGTGTAVDPFDEITQAAVDSRPGAGGVLFLPWLAGSLSPSSDPQMRGGYIGVSLATTRADMVRATLEGTARNLRWLLPAVEHMTGRPATELTFGGGAARSTEWAQCIADVLGRPVSILEAPELAAARAVAMVGLGRRRGDPMVDMELPTAARLEPDPDATAVHDELQEPFEEAFRAMKPICQALAP
jgi:xylulokinase